MKRLPSILLVVGLAGPALYAAAPATIVVGYTNTPVLPSGWRVHDIDRPQPVVVAPGGTTASPPSDAIVLFDGTGLDQWIGTKQDDPAKGRYNPEGRALWKVEKGYVECTESGAIRSRQAFGDCQLHIEWQTENPPRGDSQNRGNSGVFLMGLYEIQVLDGYKNRTYADGTTGSIYGQTPPMVNACRPPGDWQVYDIVFEAPRFEGDALVSPACATVFLNGVVVQHRTEILGPTSHKKLPVYRAHGKAPLVLQDHSNPTRFRNIWIRELDVDGKR